jgi:hypothetical protein
VLLLRSAGAGRGGLFGLRPPVQRVTANHGVLGGGHRDFMPSTPPPSLMALAFEVLLLNVTKLTLGSLVVLPEEVQLELVRAAPLAPPYPAQPTPQPTP